MINIQKSKDKLLFISFILYYIYIPLYSFKNQEEEQTLRIQAVEQFLLLGIQNVVLVTDTFMGLKKNLLLQMKIKRISGEGEDAA